MKRVVLMWCLAPAFLLHGPTFFTINRPIVGFLLIQIVLIGWLPATILVVYAEDCLGAS